MNDHETTFDAVKQTIREFASQRNWELFHKPKNLAMSIAIEAAEIMEHFQWLDASQSERENLPPEKREQIAEECADVLAYLLGLTDRLDIDLAAAFERKMQKNALKYPTGNEWRIEDGEWGIGEQTGK